MLFLSNLSNFEFSQLYIGQFPGESYQDTFVTVHEVIHFTYMYIRIHIHPSKYSWFCLSGFSETFFDINLNLVYFGDQMRDIEMSSNQINNFHEANPRLRCTSSRSSGAVETCLLLPSLELESCLEGETLSISTILITGSSRRWSVFLYLLYNFQFFCIFCICVFFKVPGQQWSSIFYF